MQQHLNALEFENVVKEYDDGIRALDGISMNVPAGSIYGFIGLNGAGKTTSIRIIAGLLKQDAGAVRVMGKEINAHDSAYKRQIGFVLDEPMYFDWMTATEYLRFAGNMHWLPDSDVTSRVGELLEFFDLSGKDESPIKTFSTGMKKKLSMAAAIIHKPQLVILDEPLEGVDALAASTIKETLTLMASRGTTIVITSHVLDTVEKFCTEVAIIHRGVILLQCPMTEIRTTVRGQLATATYASLEDLFVGLVSDKVRKKHPSWL